MSPPNTSKVKPYEYSVSELLQNIRRKVLENAAGYSGVDGTHSYEIKTIFDKTSGELLLESPTVNAFMVIGRDRNAGPSSGLQGIGYTGAASIDLIAGHAGRRPLSVYTPSGSATPKIIFTGKSFLNDTSRLYLTQRAANIDNYFGIPEAKVMLGNKPFILEANAGIGAAALSSDAVRLVARDNIKIVTIHGQINASSKPTPNNGIAIIAGANKISDDVTLNPQPMVRGNNLVQCIKGLIDLIKRTQNSTSAFLDRQIIINSLLASHVHQSNAAGLPTNEMLGEGVKIENFMYTTKDLKDMFDTYKDLGLFETKFFSLQDPNCILSPYNVNN